MNIFRKRSIKAVIFTIAGACFLMPVTGFSEDQSAGFYAGPLSVVAKTVVDAKSEKPVEAKVQLPKEAENPAEDIKKIREINNPADKPFEGLPHG